MSRQYRPQGEAEKEFVGIVEKLSSSRQKWQVWEDLITAMACALSNSVDHSPEHYEKREKEYEACIGRLGSVDLPAQAFAVVVETLDHNPDQDFLGALYMKLSLGDHWKGQFFTPYNLCRMMAEITTVDCGKMVEDRGWASICDPCIGGGAMMIAAANTLQNKGVNYQRCVLFAGQDIDRIAAQMAYIQLSLLGCPGYICIGDSLAHPMTGPVLFPQEKDGLELWYMPMFFSDIWTGRKQVRIMDGLLRSMQTPIPEEEQHDGFIYFDFTETGGSEMSEQKKQEEKIEYASAVEKLRAELEKGEADSLKSGVLTRMIERCEEDAGLAEDVLQPHKTWDRCFAYLTKKAMDQPHENKAGGVYIDDAVVYEWAEDYYHQDDKAAAEQEKKQNEEAAKKIAERRKALATKPAAADKASDKAKAEKKPAEKVQAEKKPAEKAKEPAKPKHNKNDVEGQMDIFSFLGM